MNATPPGDFERKAQQKQRSSLSEFSRFLATNKKWWITPIAVLLVLLGLLIVLGGSGMAPFIYSLF